MKSMKMAVVVAFLVLLCGCASEDVLPPAGPDRPENSPDEGQETLKDSIPPARTAVERGSLGGLDVAVLTGEGFHDTEMLVPAGYLASRGARITVIGIEPGEVTAYNSDFTVQIHRAAAELLPLEFDAVIIPGGTAPALLREDESVIDFIRAFDQREGIIAAICHGPQVLAEAGVLEDRSATAVGTVKAELEQAGARYIDAPVVRDGHLVTSRIPGDLFYFCTAIEELLLEAAQ